MYVFTTYPLAVKNYTCERVYSSRYVGGIDAYASSVQPYLWSSFIRDLPRRLLAPSGKSQLGMVFMGIAAHVYVLLFSIAHQHGGSALNPYKLGRYWKKVEPAAQHHVVPGGGLVRIHRHGGRNIITDEYKKWTDATVVYTVDPGLAQHCQTIVDAMSQISSDTDGCIQFRHAGIYDKNFVRLQPGVGCSSTIGMRPGGQTMTLQDPGCTVKSTIMHELLHTLGFCHEHTGPRRDQAIKILWDNIDLDPRKALANYGKMSEREFTDFNLGFDYDSIMLYFPKAFGRNINGTKMHTMTSNIPGIALNERPNSELSLKDIIKLRLGYKCDRIGKRPPSLYLVCP